MNTLNADSGSGGIPLEVPPEMREFLQKDFSAATFLTSKAAATPEYLVEGCLPRASITMFSATPGTGKTTVAIALSLALGEGEPFLNLQTVQCPVLFIGEDAPGWDYGGQIRRLLGGQPPSSLYVWPNLGFSLTNPEWRAKLHAFVRDRGIGLVVIDTLRAVHDLNENDAGHMQAVMDKIRRLTVETGVSVMFLHHTPKPNEFGIGSGYRGSSVMLGSCDFHILMTSERVGRSERTLEITFPKGRSPRTPDSILARHQFDDAAITITPTDLPELDARILEAAGRGTVEIKNLAYEIGGADSRPVSERTVRKAVERLVRAGKLTRETIPGRAGSPGGYRVVSGTSPKPPAP